MELCGFPIMSELTIGSSVYSKTPFIFPSAADFIAALTSSAVTDFPNVATKSTIEPSGTGTRRAKPLSLPSSSGITFPTARAAPVVVGMMFIAAARARRGSLCTMSAIR